VRDLPSGTVTFLFTDVEGSTKLLHSLGAEAYAEALAEHRSLIREACAAEGGVEVDTQGDAFFFAFPTAPGALSAAGGFTEALASGQVQVRVGLHTGTPLLTEEGYVGGDVHRAARIAAAGHGGQVLVSSSTAQLVEIELHDLGEHRFKDLSAPERVYQFGESDFPPLKSLYRTNLPVPATPFLGREAELAEVVGLLEGTRLLTLTGPGGTGKTRLALQAAAEASDRYPDGVFWIPLAPMRDSSLVLPTAARALGSSNGLAEHIADKQMLCLFDNFEHLLGAASGVADLFSSCPNLALLVTSREPLRLSGEQEYAVPPFAHREAIGFFAARARAVRSDFRLDDAVSEICRRLDDLPLALELAAVRVKSLAPAKILERLEQSLPLLTGGARDAPERQQTLRATIEWSHDLLTTEEQRLFARLAVFRGGCTLEGAEEICEADIDVLHSLVEKSLVRFSNERYWMLETIREYAAERLDVLGGADELRQRHAEWFVALADSIPRDVRVPPEWLDRMEIEHDNLRAALDHLEAAGPSQMALQLAGALARFWSLRGHINEGVSRLEAALDADERPTRERARALSGCAMLHGDAGDLARNRSRLEEALTLHQALGDEWGTTYSIYLMGVNAADSGDFTGAEPQFEQALRGFRALESEHYVLLALDALAWTYGELGDDERRRQVHEEVLERARELGSEPVVALTLFQLASLARRDGRHHDDVSMLSESLRIYRALRDITGITTTLGEFGEMLALRGDAFAAAKLVAASQTMRQRIGEGTPWISAMNETTLAAVREHLDEDAIAQAWEAGSQMAADEAVALALGESEPDA
jgi:predicted ATPase